LSPGSTRKVDIGFSPCPNDTFIFDALVHERVDTSPFSFQPHIADVEVLNEEGFSQTYPITKLSFYAYLQLKDSYALLDSGAALGYGCGPLLVALHPLVSVRKARIAVPGRYTSAYLLLQLWQGKCEHIEFVRFDEILPGVASGKYDAGLIIHEGRFVYQNYNCLKLIDLGQWWEEETGLPLPLGCIALRRDMMESKEVVETLIRNSISYARENPAASSQFIQINAQELDQQVISEHISLFVNDYSMTLGETGRKAIEALEEKARCLSIL
jgi:1,4-dihydroxy-6-naphthoate synthase